ncbi:MAG TPA: 3-hydroxyacyl-CoA dehydrogenase NAD-binding domain-containing protein [Steroidobacteraceae bacterium]|nr:3-hydroxyacyl-CoA dehydrogenase NAD-binding domain-containing protein [Steroidobacteraceae bacterium]
MIERQDRDRIAMLHMVSPPVNALGWQLRRALVRAVDAAAADAAIDAIVLTGDERAFSAGADLREFNTPAATAAPTLRDVIAVIECCSKPVVAAIRGVCMGGGLELALACHARVAAADAQLALPEVKLGLIPGAGGTQRLPRLLGMERALRVIGTGASFAAADPIWTGLLATPAAADPLAAAASVAARLAAEARPLLRVRDQPVPDAHAEGLLALARQSLGAKATVQPGAARCLDALAASVSQPFEQGLATERVLFLALQESSTARALRHAFLAEREAVHIDGMPEGVEPRAIATAAVIGAGTMGSGIALALASAGIRVQLFDRDDAALERGLATIAKLLDGSVAKGRLSRDTADQRRALVRPIADLALLADADLIVEAVFEDMAVKEQIFRALDHVVKPGAVLATNTSSLDVDVIAGFTSRPADVVGLHFFSPAHVMRLLEVVRGRRTDPAVLLTAMTLAKRLGKVAVIAGVCDGFIGNRMLDRYIRQAMYLLEEGALPQQIDRALESFGMAMGPFRVADLAGLDVSRAIRRKREAAQPGLRQLPIADSLCELGRSGQKSGRGFYVYEPGQRNPAVDDEVTALIAAYRREAALTTRVVADAEIVDRCVLALVNEGARLLEEGIAVRASDIDVVYLNGYGFPRHRGGPMFYAESKGYFNVLRTMRRFAANELADPQFWQPSAMLQQLANVSVQS